MADFRLLQGGVDKRLLEGGSGFRILEGVQGAAATTLPPHTASSAGSVSVTGLASVTLVVLTAVAAATIAIQGAASQTLPVHAASSAGGVQVQGTSALTLPVLTSSATGTSAGTLGRVTQVAQLVTSVPTPAGRVTQIAVLVTAPYVRKPGYVLIARKLVGSGDVGVPGGVASPTLPVHTAIGTGTVAAGAITGIASVTLPTHAAAAAGTALIQGVASAIALSVHTVVAVGTSGGIPSIANFRLLEGAVDKRLLEGGSGFRILEIANVAAVTLPVHTAAAVGVVAVQGASAATLSIHTALATGTTGGVSVGAAAVTLTTHTAIGAGAVRVQGAASVTLPAHVAAATGIAGAVQGAAAIALPVHTAVATGTSGGIGAIAGFRLLEGAVDRRLLEAGAGFRILQSGIAAAVTLPVHTASGAGTVLVQGAAAVTLSGHTAVAAGTSGGISLFYYVAELPRTTVQRPPNVSYAFTVTANDRATLQAEINAYAVRAGHTKIVCTNGGVAAGLVTCKKNTVGAYRCSIWSQGFDTGYFTDDKRISDTGADDAACFTMRATVGGPSGAADCQTATHDYDFGGIIFDVDPALVNDITALFNIDPGGYAQNVANICHRFYWRHCRWKDRGLTVGKLRYMMRWDCTETGIFDSVFGANWQVGTESKNLLVVTSEGNQRIYNTRIGGGAVGIMWGGSDPSITDLVPADITLERVFFTAPWQWNIWATAINNPRGAWDGISGRAMKNRLEFKTGVRVLIDDTMMEHSWTDGQTGGIWITQGANSTGGNPSAGSRDHVYRNLWVRRCGRGPNPQKTSNPNPLNYPNARIVYDNLLVTEVLGSNLYGGGIGRSIEYSGGGNQDVQFRHITGLGDRHAMMFPTCTAQRVRTVIDENIFLRGVFGIRSDGGACLEGTNTLDSTNPGHTFNSTVVVGAPAASYPATGFYPANTGAVGFVDYATGSVAETIADMAGMALTGASPYKGIGAGGADLGVDVDEIMTKLSHIMDGDWTGV